MYIRFIASVALRPTLYKPVPPGYGEEIRQGKEVYAEESRVV